MLIGIHGGQDYWEPRMSSSIQRTYELTNQVPDTSGLRDSHIVLLPCVLCHLTKGLGETLRSTLPLGFEIPLTLSPPTNHGFSRTIDMEAP